MSPNLREIRDQEPNYDEVLRLREVRHGERLQLPAEVFLGEVRMCEVAEGAAFEEYEQNSEAEQQAQTLRIAHHLPLSRSAEQHAQATRDRLFWRYMDACHATHLATIQADESQAANLELEHAVSSLTQEDRASVQTTGCLADGEPLILFDAPVSVEVAQLLVGHVSESGSLEPTWQQEAACLRELAPHLLRVTRERSGPRQAGANTAYASFKSTAIAKRERERRQADSSHAT